MKQIELSEALGKPQPYISAIETGHRRVDIVEIQDICRVLGVTLLEFVKSLEKAIQKPAKKAVSKRTRIG
jgi:transcriptional regulator with XRE-family HTH domain